MFWAGLVLGVFIGMILGVGCMALLSIANVPDDLTDDEE